MLNNKIEKKNQLVKKKNLSQSSIDRVNHV